mmetsp:Transcript_34678/g.103029  ORF Transcript_34678/g.103029 Transcript_34678/m.103029 type:complete len:459 (-) Transcript_34678:30-1406(-)
MERPNRPNLEGYAALPQVEVVDLGPGPDRDLHNARIAAGKAMGYLLKMELEGAAGVEKTSVYGAAIAIPQIARSVGWSTTMTGLAIRAYVFLLFNYFLQLFLLSVLNEELHLFNPLSGRMHLCDFGAHISNCPGGLNCRGPTGGNYSYPTLYTFSAWSVRVFTRDALVELFPDRVDEIYKRIVPGEFGVEDYYCRVACCLIFMMAVYGDLKGTLSLWWLLQHVPTRADPWITYEVPQFTTKEMAKKVKGWTELDLVKFKVAGMPLHWKVFNFFLIFLPKAFIWWTLVTSGFHFLMETADIIDCIVNCMALTFVLEIDETVFERLASVASKHMMYNLEDMQLYTTDDMENETDEEAFERFHRDEADPMEHKVHLLFLIVPGRLIGIILFVCLFIFQYYNAECVRSAEGGYISKDLYLPTDVGYNPFVWLYPSLREHTTTPIWRIPEIMRGDLPDSHFEE